MCDLDNAQSTSFEDYSSSEAAGEPGNQDENGFVMYLTKTQKKKEKKRGKNSEIERKIKELRNDESVKVNSDIEEQESESSSKLERNNPRGQSKPNSATVLYFPRDYTGNASDKENWIAEVYDNGHSIRARPGKKGLVVLAYSQETTDTLTTTGHKGVVLFQPKPREQLKKVILLGADPSYMNLDRIKQACPNISGLAWNKWSRSKKEIIGWWKGEIQDTIDVPLYEYPLRVKEYVQRPTLCGKCSRWNHNKEQCKYAPRCRYCGEGHDSSICREIIQNGQVVTPRCCNCGMGHNAGSIDCIKNPAVAITPKAQDAVSMNGKNREITREPEILAPTRQESQPLREEDFPSIRSPWGNSERINSVTRDVTEPNADLRKEVEQLKESYNKGMEQLKQENNVLKEKLNTLIDLIMKKESHQTNKPSNELNLQTENNPKMIEECDYSNYETDVQSITCENVHLKTPWPRELTGKKVKEVLARVQQENNNDTPARIIRVAVTAYRHNMELKELLKKMMKDGQTEAEQDGAPEDS